MYYLGLMSGTSVDAVDAALVRLQADTCELVQYRQYPLPADLAATLKSIAADTPLERVARCDRRLGNLFAECAMKLIESGNIHRSDIAAIGCHGQTVLHRPAPGTGNTVQIGDPNRIAWRTGITTVSDFRRMDMAAGGQGAPLAPGFHAWRFRSSDTDRVVVNIGGIANITIIPGDLQGEVSGFDVGPGNTLLDLWIRLHRNEDFDRGGEWGAGGTVIEPTLLGMLSDPYFSALPPKSTGKEYFNAGWVKRHLTVTDAQSEPRDVQATLAELTCRAIAGAITTHAPDASEILVCGGGVHNALIMKRLRDLSSPASVQTTAAYGLDPDAVEAVTFAWLAKCRLEGVAGNLPSVTGAKCPVVLGAVYMPGKVQSEK